MPRFLTTLVGAALGAAFAAAAAAQANFPERPVRMVVPFPTGGSTDIVARLVAPKMSEILGQQVVVENKGGAGGSLGSDIVAKAAPDGYTLLLGTISTHAINPALYKSLPFDPVKSFEPISLLVIVPNVVVVHPSVPAKTIQELIAHLKKKPGKLSYASSGNGTPLHLSGELFKSLTGTDMTHIPYRGAGPALIDVTSGQVPVMFDNLPASIGHVKQGTLRALGITTLKRSSAMPDLPTVDEQGVKGYETYTWNALFAPAGTPKAIIDKLNAAANAAANNATVKTRLVELSAEVVGTSPEELRKHVAAELAKWGPIVKASGATVD
ncbi:MAG: tripartite tricarboxylate transporter substrate binding protein [Alphaproteobacteria bacterium]|nr:tripartite tricarboxylate transporter substrate binding protein [Alphaproteobacteria bacterium]